jgi:hypothetical protein
VGKLFPDDGSVPSTPDSPTYFPAIQASLIPIGDNFPAPLHKPAPPGEPTPVALSPVTLRSATRPITDSFKLETLAPDPRPGPELANEPAAKATEKP